MLRIGTAKKTDSNVATLERSTLSASGGQPTLAANSSEATETAAEGLNWGASVIPWLTEELRFHSVLDLGCGDDVAVNLLNDAGYEAHGVDRNIQTDASRRLTQGDIFAIDMPDGYFDLVLCADVLQEIETSKVTALLAEIDRLSNSYVFLVVPNATDAKGQPRNVYWWCQRLADFDWRLRLVREDDETGRIAFLIEKANSLASQVLPLLDKVTENRPQENRDVESLKSMVNTMIGDFRAGRFGAGFDGLDAFAQALQRLRPPLPNIKAALTQIVEAMERKDFGAIVGCLENFILPALNAR